MELSNHLDFGIVGINESVTANEIGAFAGRKQSGFGVEGSVLGLKEYLVTKYKCMNY
jgi:acyl-CoA reductase-like NAD-dependent aldehyde dehydrogenase